jgi:hypothetical protein
LPDRDHRRIFAQICDALPALRDARGNFEVLDLRSSILR